VIPLERVTGASVVVYDETESGDQGEVRCVWLASYLRLEYEDGIGEVGIDKRVDVFDDEDWEGEINFESEMNIGLSSG
jgi:hypothetical protein